MLFSLARLDFRLLFLGDFDEGSFEMLWRLVRVPGLLVTEPEGFLADFRPLFFKSSPILLTVDLVN